jgi:hypothetical protein
MADETNEQLHVELQDGQPVLVNQRGQVVGAGLKMASTSIRVIRADGTVEDYGTVSYWHRNPLRRLWHWFTNRNRKPVITHKQ